MPLLYHAYVYLEFLILACTIYILATVDPIIEEEFDPDRTILVLTFAPKKKQKNKRRKTSDEKQAIKTSDEKQAIKTSDKNKR